MREDDKRCIFWDLASYYSSHAMHRIVCERFTERLNGNVYVVTSSIIVCLGTTRPALFGVSTFDGLSGEAMVAY